MQHGIIHQTVVIAVQHFTHQEEIRFQAVTECPEFPHKVLIQTVGYIKTQTIDIKFLHPASDTVKNMLFHIRMAEIQFYQVIIAFPALIPQPVIVVGVSVKADMEPVFVRRIPAFFQDILKCPESAADMIEYAVQHDFDSFLVQCLADIGKIFVCAQTYVDFTEISGIISMGIGFKYR